VKSIPEVTTAEKESALVIKAWQLALSADGI